eukprot:CAMPEP_0172572666 /NCGR_PEP_ID=MMETSP1067-20121228/135794_1 /TAXON_ID=265564 ORGANISM="Thalassiosira punctigera, Strain Tpunct2005C2" /NCGR_SAMPLE_ID=MMETSP1067 /ASSEMBLY_ACC=CAM_ASM_000444 /LENGTH=204 /DNA_ID=CAMNT_0013365249 /DNA_START=39 /DNA_END=653 /DNA_ORIENTATION=+
MMKLAVLATLAASAAAFAPVQTGKASTALKAFEGELGVQPPVGFFDPLGLLDEADQERFDRLRYVEVKHGRIAQLAFLGNIFTRAGGHFGGNIDKAGHPFDSFPNGWAAIWGPDAIPGKGFVQIFSFIGLLEIAVMKDMPGFGNQFPGDLRNGTFQSQWDKLDEETQFRKRGIELNNGRAAMMGILGLMMHEQLGGTIPIVGEM